MTTHTGSSAFYVQRRHIYKPYIHVQYIIRLQLCWKISIQTKTVEQSPSESNASLSLMLGSTHAFLSGTVFVFNLIRSTRPAGPGSCWLASFDGKHAYIDTYITLYVHTVRVICCMDDDGCGLVAHEIKAGRHRGPYGQACNKLQKDSRRPGIQCLEKLTSPRLASSYCSRKLIPADPACMSWEPGHIWKEWQWRKAIGRCLASAPLIPSGSIY
jgi:hypothetical protein